MELALPGHFSHLVPRLTCEDFDWTAKFAFRGWLSEATATPFKPTYRN